MFTRGYVTATGLHDDPATIAASSARRSSTSPRSPPGGDAAASLLELTTHGGHFLGAAVSRLVIWEDADGAALSATSASGTRSRPTSRSRSGWPAGRRSVAFWGGGAPEDSMLHQLGARRVAPGVSGSAGTPTETDRPPDRPLNARR